MSNYIGVRCPVCNKKFSEADDIVVCPVCGAPHHRDCYAGMNQCAFAADHLSGKEWRDPAGEAAQAESGGDGVKTCQRCGASNTSESIFCQICGNPFPTARNEGAQAQQSYGFPGFDMRVDTISMAYGGIDPEEEIAGEKVKDIARYIGGGSAYYLPRFYLMSRHNRTVTFNLSALIFSFFYYFYRKMYLVGVFLAVLCVVSNIPSLLYTWEVFPDVMHQMGIGPAVELDMAMISHLEWLNRITRSINFIITLIVSICANRYYFTRTINAVREIRTEGERREATPQQYSERLARMGGTNKAAVAVIAALLIVLLFSLSGALANQYMSTLY